jgi:hypothetical protein
MQEMNGSIKHQCECGKDMKRIYYVPMLKAEFWEYKDPTLGHVKSRADKKAKMKAQGLAEYEPTHFKGEAGTEKRERYNKFAEKLCETKDYYKHKGIKYHDVKV